MLGELLQQRRIWAGIFASIAFIISAFGIQMGFDATVWTEAVMKLVEAISGLMAVILPLVSYFKPKD